MATLKKGDRAPGFALADQAGKIVKLSDYRGRRVLLYFYPKADTPGCTLQACAVRDARGELDARGVASLGISPDAPGAQRSFDEKHGLGFPLLSDPDHATAAAYGAWGEKTIYGKPCQGIIRSAFLIDEKGRVLEASYKVKPADTVPLALA